MQDGRRKVAPEELISIYRHALKENKVLISKDLPWAEPNTYKIVVCYECVLDHIAKYGFNFLPIEASQMIQCSYVLTPEGIKRC